MPLQAPFLSLSGNALRRPRGDVTVEQRVRVCGENPLSRKQKKHSKHLLPNELYMQNGFHGHPHSLCPPRPPQEFHLE